MKENFMIDAINRMDYDLIEEYANEKERLKKNRMTRKKTAWLKWGAVAAGLCLMIMGAVIWQQIGSPGMGPSTLVVDANGVTIPKRNISLSADQSADMLSFFIYNGHCYVQYEEFSDCAELVGEKLGTATGLIDEWTTKDGYVELAGSVKGDFYAVKGYDPSFMLCMQKSDGTVSAYICNSGITLKYGEELFEERLLLSEGYASVTYESRESRFYSKGERYELSKEVQPIIADFIAAIDKAEFMPWEAVAPKEGHTQSTIYDTEIFHVYFHMENGTAVHLRLYENGYVRYQGLLDVCVQVPTDSFDEFIALIKKP